MSSTVDPPPRQVVPNRQVRIVEVGGSGAPVWSVQAPVRGEGLRSATVSAADRPDVHRVFEQIASGAQVLDLDVATAETLLDLGVLIDEGSESRAVTFAVPLPTADGPAGGAALRRNPNVRVGFAPANPPFDAGPTVEVFDPGRRAAFAYWLDAEQAAAFEDLCDGRPTSELPGDVLAAFAASDVVIADDAPPCAWRPSDRAPISRPGCLTLRSLMPAPYVRALQHYTRTLVREGHLVLGDAQSDRRYTAHNDPVAEWLHGLLLPAVQAFVRDSLRPSYSYLLAYLGGAALAAHTDRAQCEYTLSLAVDATPDDSRSGAWPLHLRHTSDSLTASVLLAPGDALLFTGRELEHHRDPLPDGHTSAALLLHFVGPTFAGSLV